MNVPKSKPKTTVVVSQRERINTTAWSLESLFATITPDIPVVVITSVPGEILARKLDDIQHQRPFKHIVESHFITPNASRNIGARLAGTEFIVFVDNDVLYEPDWLEALESNARRNDASVVEPLICIGPPRAARIHHAGGLLHAEGGPEHPVISERHRLMDRAIKNFNRLTAPVENEITEFHCVLLRRDLFDEIGFFDERLITREQVDFALRIKAAGKTVTFERNAVVTHVRGGRLTATDLDYFLDRWNHQRAWNSLIAFEETWDVTIDKERILSKWIAWHRVRAIGEYTPVLRRLAGSRLFRRFIAPRIEASRKLQPFVSDQDIYTPPPPSKEARTSVYRELLERDGRLEAALATQIVRRPDPTGYATPVIAGMATMPSRQETVTQAIASALPQVDGLYLFLDGFAEVPEFADHPKIVPLLSNEYGDLKANGKFLGLALHAEPCLYFSLDDDIAYPDDYVDRMRSCLENYGSGVIMGVHASVMNQTVESYRRDRVVVHRSRPAARDFLADVLGTCSVAFSTTDLRFDVREWTVVNMVDLYFSRLARQQGLAMIGISRGTDWLGCLQENQPDSIYAALKADDRQQTLLARSIFGKSKGSIPVSRQPLR